MNSTKILGSSPNSVSSTGFSFFAILPSIFTSTALGGHRDRQQLAREKCRRSWEQDSRAPNESDSDLNGKRTVEDKDKTMPPAVSRQLSRGNEGQKSQVSSEPVANAWGVYSNFTQYKYYLQYIEGTLPGLPRAQTLALVSYVELMQTGFG
ncbi:hypothetical protein C8R45DRAFT_942424 [Mycena sanguinolenta]|nr:hypothetical protein C8R45DRAFT_942424 [Mycena sanguinolenta]